MVLSKRERYIAIATAGALGVLGLDQFVVAPLLASGGELESQIASRRQDLDKAQRLITNSRRNGRLWASMLNSGLRRKDASEAEGQVLNSIRDWAQDAGMSLSSVKPERSEKEKDFQKITFRATGGGGMAQISRFLWRIQTAGIPVRVSDLQVSAHKEDTDDLSLQLGISTVYLISDSDKDSGSVAASSSLEARP